jgi:hypothetical protein
MKAVPELPNYYKMAEIVEVGVSLLSQRNMNKGLMYQKQISDRWRIHK